MYNESPKRINQSVNQKFSTTTRTPFGETMQFGQQKFQWNRLSNWELTVDYNCLSACYPARICTPARRRRAWCRGERRARWTRCRFSFAPKRKMCRRTRWTCWRSTTTRQRPSGYLKIISLSSRINFTKKLPLQICTLLLKYVTSILWNINFHYSHYWTIIETLFVA